VGIYSAFACPGQAIAARGAITAWTGPHLGQGVPGILGRYAAFPRAPVSRGTTLDLKYGPGQADCQHGLPSLSGVTKPPF
jgi:hypothetical protein